MPSTFVDVEAFRAEAKAGRAPDAPLFKLATSEPQTVAGAGSRVRRFVFSTADVDHSNDSINQSGWDLSVHRSNPVILFGHDSLAPPIGKASNVSVVNNRLMGDVEFADVDTYAFADTVFRLVAGGFMRAVSVGFIPKSYSFTTDRNRPNGLDFKSQVLLETSVVPIPANPQALIQARANGIDTRQLRDWAERVLDGEGSSSLARRDLESLHRAAAEPRRARVVRRGAGADAVNGVIDNIAASIAATREHMKCLKDLIPGGDDDDDDDDDPDFDEGEVARAMGHLRESVARKSRAISCLRDALSAAPSGPRPPPPVDEHPPQIAAMRRSTPARTPAERLREVAELRRIADRQEEVAAILRRLRA